MPIKARCSTLSPGVLYCPHTLANWRPVIPSKDHKRSVTPTDAHWDPLKPTEVYWNPQMPTYTKRLTDIHRLPLTPNQARCRWLLQMPTDHYYICYESHQLNQKKFPYPTCNYPATTPIVSNKVRQLMSMDTNPRSRTPTLCFVKLLILRRFIGNRSVQLNAEKKGQLNIEIFDTIIVKFSARPFSR